MISETVFSLSGEFVTVEQIFQDGLKIDENKFSNVWLTDLPHLARECSTRTLTSVLSDVVKIGENDFQVENETFEDIAELLVPKQFPKKFPVVETSGDKISRILLRRELITRWNKRIESLGADGCDLPSKEIVLSASGGLGKSIDLYLFAVFAKHCRIPVQYIGNTSEWLKTKHMSKCVIRYLKMLLFMNADILDELPNFETTYYDSLSGAPLKSVIYFAIKQKDMSLAMDIRRFMTRRRPRNFLIVDELNALWRKFGENIRSWPGFVASYTNLEAMCTEYCGILIAGSEHHAFEDKLPGGYTSAKDYVDPLNFEEFEVWQLLPDYPQILREHQEEVVELTGLVPRMLAEMVSIGRENPNFSFEKVAGTFFESNYSSLKGKHEQYLNSLTYETDKANFLEMLRLLFLGGDALCPRIYCSIYRDRALLTMMKNGTLRFYNSIASDILFDAFSSYFLTSDSLKELSVKLSNTSGIVEWLSFEQKFFLWCLYKCSSWELYLPRHQRTIKFESNKWMSFDEKHFNPIVSKVTATCWIKIFEFYPLLHFAYVDVRNDGWNLYLMQASISSFRDYNRESSNRIEVLLEPPDKAPLVSLLNSFFGQTDFQVSTVRDDSGKIIDFKVTDSNGHSFRDRISILYITSLIRKKAQVSEAPSYVEIIALEDFPEDCKRYLGL